MFRGRQPGQPKIPALTRVGAPVLRTFLSIAPCCASVPGRRLLHALGTQVKPRQLLSAPAVLMAPGHTSHRKLISEVCSFVRVCSQERENTRALLRRKEFSPQLFIRDISRYTAKLKDCLYSETLPLPLMMAPADRFLCPLCHTSACPSTLPPAISPS